MYLCVFNFETPRYVKFANTLLTSSHIYPAGFIEETLRTLALLLPRSDKDTRDWFIQQQKTHNLDPEAANCRALSRDERTIDKFQ